MVISLKTITLEDVNSLIESIDLLLETNDDGEDCSNSVHPDEMFLITSIYELENRWREDGYLDSPCVRLNLPLSILLRDYIATDMERTTQYHSMKLEGYLEDFKYGIRDANLTNSSIICLRLATAYGMIPYLKEKLVEFRNK